MLESEEKMGLRVGERPSSLGEPVRFTVQAREPGPGGPQGRRCCGLKAKVPEAPCAVSCSCQNPARTDKADMFN